MRLCLCVVSLFLFLPAMGRAAPAITSESVEIGDKVLEKRLAKLVKERGTLTSTRQVDSYLIAVLCEYPHAEANPAGKTKPSCVFRKVKVQDE